MECRGSAGHACRLATSSCKVGIKLPALTFVTACCSCLSLPVMTPHRALSCLYLLHLVLRAGNVGIHSKMITHNKCACDSRAEAALADAVSASLTHQSRSSNCIAAQHSKRRRKASAHPVTRLEADLLRASYGIEAELYEGL